MTRVLAILGGLQIGGTEQYVTRAAPLLRGRGIEIEICALERDGPLLERLLQAEIPVHGTSYIERSRRSNTLTLMQTVAEIRRLVRRRRYDVVHTYLFWADVLGTAAARLAGCPRVIVSRRALHSARHGPSRFHHALELGSNLAAHELIANSKAVMRDVEATERFLPSRRAVIYNGIDVAAFQPARPGSSGPLKLLTVGSLSEHKGLEYAVEALGLLKAGGVDARLTLVGSGPEERMLKALAERLGLEERVSFAGAAIDPRSHFLAADVFLLPSRREGFSNALLEAMASGLPVVATNVGGNAEAVVDGEGGRILPPGDPRAIAQAVTELASDRKGLREIGLANRARVEKLFTLEASAERLAAWYSGGWTS